jgi:hypothetical protein
MIHEHKVFVNSQGIELDLIVASAMRQFKPADLLSRTGVLGTVLTGCRLLNPIIFYIAFCFYFFSQQVQDL